jgi:hypothetical protein
VGRNGGAFAAGGGIGAAGSFGGTANTTENANALSGGVTATIVLGANHYTASGGNDAGIANAGERAGRLRRIVDDRGLEPLQHVDRLEYRGGRIAVGVGRQSGQSGATAGTP